MKGTYILRMRHDRAPNQGIRCAAELVLALRQLAERLEHGVWSLGNGDEIEVRLFVDDRDKDGTARYDLIGALTYESEPDPVVETDIDIETDSGDLSPLAALEAEDLARDSGDAALHPEAFDEGNDL